MKGENPMARWLKENAADADIAVSTRARLARNMAGVPFPHRIRGTAQAGPCAGRRQTPFWAAEDFSCVVIRDLRPAQREYLTALHVISPELAALPDGEVIRSRDDAMSVMLLEEDHYRLQYLTGGFAPEEAYRVCREMERMLGKHTAYAFDKRLGYLTACPSNVGTGLRLSAMLHLKGLSLSGNVDRVLGQLGQFGLTARGAYGEGTAPVGDFYQVSNQVTLGVSEADTLKNLRQVAGRLIAQEREVRQILYKNNRLEIEDRVMRAYGTLKHARPISREEASELLSTLALGMGWASRRPAPRGRSITLLWTVCLPCSRQWRFPPGNRM
ncbi:MAG: hypothetical protein V8Q43_04400 [Christensenellaceae bacterium]